jgi:predicted O-methyltransferase YrrM
MARKNKFFNSEYYKRVDYIRSFVSEDSILKTIRLQAKYNNFSITLNPEEGQFLSIIATIMRAKNVLEIGTLFGYSTIWLARVVEKVVTIEKDVCKSKIAEDNFIKANLDNIEVVNGNALTELERLCEQNMVFDMVFIDADKINYINYLKFCEKLLKRGGVLVADNIMLSGEVCNDYTKEVKFTTLQNMKEFNKMLADRTKYRSVMLNCEDGLSVAVKL